MPEAIQRSHELAQPRNFFELRLITSSYTQRLTVGASIAWLFSFEENWMWVMRLPVRNS